jgi:hypothetical protein
MRQRLKLAGAALCALTLATPSALAQQPAQVTVLASGLDNPRDMDFAFDGSIWIAESGHGGPAPQVPAPGGGINGYGPTGAIARYAHGQLTRIHTGLGSLAQLDGSGASGANGISMRGFSAFVIFGNPGPEVGREGLGELASQFGVLQKIRPNGFTRTIADVTAFEYANDPVPSDANPLGNESNPYAIAPMGLGHAVTDAAGNTVVFVSPLGHVTLLAAFPARHVPAPPPGETIAVESVPTALAQKDWSTVFVGEFTGVPYPKGEARIHEVDRQGHAGVVATGFTNIIDLAVGPDGKLYVLEFTKNGLFSGDSEGRIVRIEHDGTHTDIPVPAFSLTFPTSLLVAPDGTIYVTNNGLFAGTGELLRIDQP